MYVLYFTEESIILLDCDRLGYTQTLKSNYVNTNILSVNIGNTL